MSHLKLVPKPAKPLPQKKRGPVLYTGQSYRVDEVATAQLSDVEGIVGDYRIGANSGTSLPIVPANDNVATCYLWDEGVELGRLTATLNGSGSTLPFNKHRIRSNRLLLNNSQLLGPALIEDGENTTLSMTAAFNCSFISDAQAATLGMIHLVQSRRFALLEDGSEFSLQQTPDDTPVLYLANADEAVVKPVVALQAQRVTESYDHHMTISQEIPAAINGVAVASLTVLEQFTSYFMQHPALPRKRATIWVPLYAPISWGWSIRVARRFDGDWAIQRRKLILPTTGHEGLQLPVWHSNTLAYRQSLPEEIR